MKLFMKTLVDFMTKSFVLIRFNVYSRQLILDFMAKGFVTITIINKWILETIIE